MDIQRIVPSRMQERTLYDERTATRFRPRPPPSSPGLIKCIEVY